MIRARGRRGRSAKWFEVSLSVSYLIMIVSTTRTTLAVMVTIIADPQKPTWPRSADTKHQGTKGSPNAGRCPPPYSKDFDRRGGIWLQGRRRATSPVTSEARR